MATSTAKRPKRREPLLYQAARLIEKEHDNMVNSIPRATLYRLERIAAELREIEDRF